MAELAGTAGRIQVGVRMCPPRQGEKVIVHADSDDQRAVLIDAEGGRASTMFKFDRVFTGGQDEVYETIGRPMLKEAFEGFNVCLFAYGQTGSGKTHSLFGDLNSKEGYGVAPRFAQDMIEEAQLRVESDSAATIKFFVTMIEVYMEKVRDLLAPRARGQEPESLEIHEDSQHRVYVKGAGVHSVLSLERMLELLKKGNANRQTGETKMNETSSRSHAIVQITISQKYGSLDMRDVESVVLLVDLAGSERQSKTESTGVAFEEAKKINQSLLMLGRAMNSFSDRKGGDAFISLRASKLTRLLSESFGGNSKTWMLATVSTAANNLTETISTLEYAQNAMAITNKAKVNDTKKNIELKRLRELVASLEGRLDVLALEKQRKQEEIGRLTQERDKLRQEVAFADSVHDARDKLELALNNIRLSNIALRRRVEAASEGFIHSLDNKSCFLFFKGRCSITLESVLRGQRRSFYIGLLTESGVLTEATLHIQLFPCEHHANERNDPMQFIGKSLRFCLHVVGASGIPKAFVAHTFCKFTLLHDREERYFTTSTAENTQNPRWGYVKVFEIPELTAEVIRCFCEHTVFAFEVFAFNA
ncbi:putative kinesin [Trypanosoma cruzi]|uniref:Kinesin, putative n=2 Tax=Trypanosoma cruzi TaxID=5693 RepID=Q4E670_TRYCC|nr:kinesin, putative [Trypanosoma cruzi]EAO00200.1 kinesin, putative [Trypanosoma cruzi]PWV18136.1 putative kinesin [Trypanosoma cruzi]|eukprot:XP_822051.1 kinesin [Trypanosoma cruzi strain CL Brener]